jgi:hypothetical protein
VSNGRSLVRGQRLVIRLLTTWGDRNYIGLTQLDVLIGDKAVPFRLELANVDASPRDLASVCFDCLVRTFRANAVAHISFVLAPCCVVSLQLGYNGDPRTLDKVSVISWCSHSSPTLTVAAHCSQHRLSH